MALDPSACAADIATLYQDVASIDANGDPVEDYVVTGEFPADWADAYNAYATDGVVLGAANTGGDASILQGAMEGVTSAPTTVTLLATALANFWATVAVDPGSPAHGGTAVSGVVNNAATLVSAFEAAITASITSAESTPWFATFISNVQTIAVSQIVWTVTELMPPSGTPADYPEAIA